MAVAAAVPPSSVTYLITGASRGLGRAIATIAGKHHVTTNDLFRTKARFLLVSRSSKDLEETKKQILSSSSSAIASNDILYRSMDLSDLDALDSNINQLLDNLSMLLSQDHEQKEQEDHNYRRRLVFVNNAASLGYLGPSCKSPSLEGMREAIDFNVTGSLWLTVRWAQYAKRLQEQQPEQPNASGIATSATIVNISSLLGVSHDFPGTGIYSAGKAAREMYHALLGRETSDSLKVLNYAPGPLETSMAKDLHESGVLREHMLEQQQQALLHPEDSARKLIRLLESNDFASGSHVDYYDLPPL